MTSCPPSSDSSTGSCCSTSSRGWASTFKHLLKQKVTVQYPEERKEPAHRFRGMFRLDIDRCIKCTLCAATARSTSSTSTGTRRRTPQTGKKEKVLDRFDIDVQRCMFCGLCEEACPTEPKSIWLTTKTYELATYDRWQNLYVDMHQLEDWKVRPAYTDEEIA